MMLLVRVLFGLGWCYLIFLEAGWATAVFAVLVMIAIELLSQDNVTQANKANREIRDLTKEIETLRHKIT